MWKIGVKHGRSGSHTVAHRSEKFGTYCSDSCATQTRLAVLKAGNVQKCRNHQHFTTGAARNVDRFTKRGP